MLRTFINQIWPGKKALHRGSLLRAAVIVSFSFLLVGVLVAGGAARAYAQDLLVPIDDSAGSNPENNNMASEPSRLNVPDMTQSVSSRMRDDGYAQGQIMDVSDGEVIRLASGKSRLLQLPTDVRDVVIGNPDVADVVVRTPRQAFLMARETGTTNIYFLNATGEVVLRAEVGIVVDMDTLNATLASLMPNEPVRVEAANDTIFLKGRLSSDTAVVQAMRIARRFVASDEALVNLMSVGQEQQVLMQVRVAEVARSTLKELGVNLSNLTDNLNTLTWTAATAVTGLSGSTVAATFGLSGVGGGIPFNLAIRALEQKGLVKTLAEPNLTAVSGETAELVAGGEYPYPVSDGSGGVSIQFRPYGVTVNFTPVVLSDGRISLRLASEVSSIDSNVQVTIGGSTVNGFKVRRANTSIELPSGGSLMIAGLLQNDSQQSLNGVPGLMDVPVLGPLFSSKSFQRAESELVIMVTTYLVDPVQPGKLAAPTDGFAAPNDLDFYLLNRLHHIYTGQTTLPANGVSGPIGYIVR